MLFNTKIIELAYDGLFLILILSGPPIAISMFFGLGVAIFQAATQIQEQTLSFTIKLVAVIFTLVFLGPWLGNTVINFAKIIFLNFYKWTS